MSDDQKSEPESQAEAAGAGSAVPEPSGAEAQAHETATEDQGRGEAQADREPAAADDPDAPRDETSTDGKPEAATAPRAKETWTNTLLWVLGIAVVLGVELFVYGHDGRIQVCVGIDTLTDFKIKNEPRSKANAKQHPFCAERMNLGMWTSGDEQSQAALNDACSAAARIVGMEHKPKCLRRDEPWTRHVEVEQVMPWDPRLYRRLLWLE